MKRRSPKEIDKTEAIVTSKENSPLRDSRGTLVLADDVDLEELGKQLRDDFEDSLTKTLRVLLAK